MNEKIKAFFKEILIIICLVVGINLFAFIAIKLGFLNSEYSMTGCTFIGVGAYLVYFFTKLKGKKEVKRECYFCSTPLIFYCLTPFL